MGNTFQDGLQFALNAIEAMLLEEPNEHVRSWMQKTYDLSLQPIAEGVKDHGISYLNDLSRNLEKNGYYDSFAEIATKAVLQVLCERLNAPLIQEAAARGLKV